MKKYWIALIAVIFIVSPLAAHAYESTSAQSLCNPKTAWLKMESRRLWAQHSHWTHDAIGAILEDSPNKEAVMARLLRNQVDIGNWFKDFYGNISGDHVADLLEEHVLIGSKVIEALGKDDKEAYQPAITAWYENSDELSRYLYSLNPDWNTETMRKLMDAHLELVEKQAAAHHAKNWDKVVSLTDKSEDHLLELADIFTKGVISQFPEKFQIQ